MPPPPPKHQPAAKGAANQNLIPRVTKLKEEARRKATAAPKETAPVPPRRPPSTSRALPRLLPGPLAARLEGAHKPAALVLASSLLMQASVDVYEAGIFSAGAAEAAAAATTTAATTAAAVSAAAAPSLPLPALAGAALGLLYACALLPLAARHTARASAPKRPLSAVVTGGSKGLGKAMAREHLLAGDSVVVAARDWGRLLRAARELSEETGAELVVLEEEEEKEEDDSIASSSLSSSAAAAASSSSPPLSAPASPRRPPTITPIACDVSDAASVARLVSESLRAFGKGKGREANIDCFYANAGDSGSLRGFGDSDPEALARVVSTNLLGAVLCSRAAMEAMMTAGEEGGQQQEGGSSSPLAGHIFLVEGAGSDGFATPGYAAYGATKAAIAQLARSLAAEQKEKKNKKKKALSSARRGGGGVRVVGFHALSPGLVLTPLLLDGVFPPTQQQGTAEAATDKLPAASLEEKMRAMAFDALAELPETAAAFLVPRARALVAVGDASSAVRYLTPLRAVARLFLAPFRRGRHFDAETAAPRWESSDAERLFGPKTRRRSRRDRARAAARGGSLALSFAVSSAALFVVLVTGGGGGGGGV